MPESASAPCEFTIRELERQDFTKGYFETLASLRSVEGLSVKHAEAIFDGLRQAWAYQPYHHFVAITDGQVVGVLTLLVEQKFTRGGARAGHIEDVATREGYQGRGIGKALMQHALEVARNEGCYKVVLDCDEHNVGFYQKCGFVRHGVEMKHYFSQKATV